MGRKTQAKKRAASVATAPPLTTVPEQPQKPHLSWTQINMFLRCPEQYYQRYILGKKAPPSGALVLGRAGHAAIEHNFRQKITSGKDVPLDEVQDVFSESLTETIRQEQPQFDEGETADGLKDQGVQLVAVHHQHIAPGVHPAAVEEPFRVSLGEDFPYDLLGYLDVIETDGTIADAKFYGRTPSQKDVDDDGQLTAYAVGYRLQHGRQERGLRLDVVTKTKTPKATQIHTARTIEQCDWFLFMVERVARAIQAGNFFPNPNGWHCDQRFCGYYAECKARRK